MGTEYLIDTNTLIDSQSGKLHDKGLAFLAEIINSDFTISFISYIEFLGYNSVTSKMEQFIQLANVIEVNKAIIDATITLRKSRRIKLPDAIVAATCLTYNRTLVTRNIDDFRNINGLVVINPWD